MNGQRTDIKNAVEAVNSHSCAGRRCSAAVNQKLSCSNILTPGGPPLPDSGVAGDANKSNLRAPLIKDSIFKWFRAEMNHPLPKGLFSGDAALI